MKIQQNKKFNNNLYQVTIKWDYKEDIGYLNTIQRFRKKTKATTLKELFKPDLKKPIEFKWTDSSEITFKNVSQKILSHLISKIEQMIKKIEFSYIKKLEVIPITNKN